LREQLPEKNEADIVEWADEVNTTLTSIENKRESLRVAKNRGMSTADWFTKDMETVTSVMSSRDASRFTSTLDNAISQNNAVWEQTLLTQSGNVNLNPQLHGFIFETSHVNSFNANAAAIESPYRAELVNPEGVGYSKNGVDIVIKDTSTGKTVSRYQAKCGQDSDHTQAAFDHGDYRGQQKLVPSGQTVDGKQTYQLEAPDGTKSKPVSYDEAKTKQNEAQKSNEVLKDDYTTFDRKVIFKECAKAVGIAGVMAAGISAAMEIGTKLVKGEEIDGAEVAANAIIQGTGVSAKTAAALAVKVQIEKNAWKILPTLKGTPLVVLVTAIDIGIENAKVFYKVGTSELTIREGLEVMYDNTCVGVCGAIGATVTGGLAGEAIAAMAIIPPLSAIIAAPAAVLAGVAAVGAIVGGIVGGMAGSKVGHAIAQGTKAVGKFIVNTIKTVASGIKAVGSAIYSGVSAIGSAVGCFIAGVGELLGIC
jgi:hypothetical protein